MITHQLKTWRAYFEAVERGEKTFEVRRNDRDFAVGDKLELREYDPTRCSYTGRWLTCTVTYCMAGGAFGIAPDYCVLGIKLP